MKCPYCKKEMPNRSSQQGKALWVFYQLLADTLNDMGLEPRKLLKPEYNLRWTKQSVHDDLWIPIQRALFKKDSTRDLRKLEEIDLVHTVLMRELAEKHSVEFIPFPHDEHRVGELSVGKNYAL
jgi:hypothetical protein